MSLGSKNLAVPQGLKPVGRFGAIAAAVLAAALPAVAQYPGQVQEKNPNAPQLRSVAVVEWTGDLNHPKASRLIPISVWDGHELQDGGIYLARPQPLALDPETRYELQKDGKNIGFYDLHDAARQRDSWIGLGAFKPLPKAPSPTQLAKAAAKQKVDMDDADSDAPVLHRKHHDGDTGEGRASKASAPDPDRPTLHKGNSDGSTDSADNKPAAPQPDPNRPRLHGDDDKPAADSDRPKLHNDPGPDVAHVTDLPNIADPDRPRLSYGAPAAYGPAVKPTLVGLPPELQQDVAVSDARSIKEHSWDFAWANVADEAKMKSDLEDVARKALGLDTAAQPAPAATKAKAHRTSARHKTPPPPPPPPVPLQNEQFRVFELQYGSGATLVLSAQTAGTGADQKFVTLVAQPDLYGGLVVLLKNVTDAAHLDMTPRMRLVDAVDAEADNRGELLFELRGHGERQFALYRVLRGQVAKIFTSGATYFGSQGE